MNNTTDVELAVIDPHKVQLTYMYLKSCTLLCTLVSNIECFLEAISSY